MYRLTKLTDKQLAEKYRMRVTKKIKEAHATGQIPLKTFREACSGYLDAGGSEPFLVPIRRRIGKKLLRDIGQPDLDSFVKRLHPQAQPVTLNRQVYIPLNAVWNLPLRMIGRASGNGADLNDRTVDLTIPIRAAQGHSRSSTSMRRCC